MLVNTADSTIVRSRQSFFQVWSRPSAQLTDRILRSSIVACLSMIGDLDEMLVVKVIIIMSLLFVSGRRRSATRRDKH